MSVSLFLQIVSVICEDENVNVWLLESGRSFWVISKKENKTHFWDGGRLFQEKFSVKVPKQDASQARIEYTNIWFQVQQRAYFVELYGWLQVLCKIPPTNHYHHPHSDTKDRYKSKTQMLYMKRRHGICRDLFLQQIPSIHQMWFVAVLLQPWQTFSSTWTSTANYPYCNKCCN